MYAALIAVTEKLSKFRVSSLIDNAAATILNATDAETADTPRRGGASYPMSSVVWGRSEGLGMSGVQGSGNPQALAPST